MRTKKLATRPAAKTVRALGPRARRPDEARAYIEGDHSCDLLADELTEHAVSARTSGDDGAAGHALLKLDGPCVVMSAAAEPDDHHAPAAERSRDEFGWDM